MGVGKKSNLGKCGHKKDSRHFVDGGEAMGLCQRNE
jgi:hypothetical protein